MNRKLLAGLGQAIEELGHRRYLTGDPVRRAKDDALDALVLFQSQPLQIPLHDALDTLRRCLDDVDPDEPAREWEAVLYAWQALEREASRE